MVWKLLSGNSERVKNTKLVRAISYVMKIRIKVELPNALPEGRGENH